LNQDGGGGGDDDDDGDAAEDDSDVSVILCSYSQTSTACIASAWAIFASFFASTNQQKVNHAPSIQ